MLKYFYIIIIIIIIKMVHEVQTLKNPDAEKTLWCRTAIISTIYWHDCVTVLYVLQVVVMPGTAR